MTALTVTAANGTEFRAVHVPSGRTIYHPEPGPPIIEIYGPRFPDMPDQFICWRHELAPGELVPFPNIPHWTLDADTVDRIIDWAAALPPSRFVEDGHGLIVNGQRVP